MILPDLFKPEENLQLEKKTLVFLRWIAIIGQLIAILIVQFLFEFNFNYLLCISIVFFSVLTNLFLQFKIKDPIKLGSDEPEEWRKRYYHHYFHTNDNEIDNYSKRMSEQYYLGMVWVANYYFDTCPSWNWYYPYDHGPLLVDLSRTLEL